MSRVARVLLLACLPLVLAPNLGSAQDAELMAFKNLNHCPFVERLQRLRENQSDRNRFIVLAVTDFGQRYVQCLWSEDSTELLCEASSGRYGAAEGEEHFFRVSADGIVILDELGFDTEQSEGNYQIYFDFSSGSDLNEPADIVLDALYYVYGASSGRELHITAPLAPPLAPGTSPCDPLS